MFDERLDANAGVDASSLDLLMELEQNTPDAIRKQRSHTRFTLRSRIIAQPGNASDRLKMKIQGVSGDISTGGCQVLFPIPIRVGDIYWFSFDRDVLDVPPAFARCLRCRMIREDAYEAGFSFFDPIQLPEQLEEKDDADLLA